MPKVSVVMPSFNHARFVLTAIASIQAQTFTDWELIVVDDGSTDGSQAFLRANADAKTQVVLLEENRGACFAMNAAIDRAQGDYIAVLNSDDVAKPNRLCRQLAHLEANPNLLAVFALADFVNDEGLSCSAGTNAVFARAPDGGRAIWLRYFIDETNCLCHPTLLARRSMYDRVGRYDNALEQLPDFDFWVRVLQVGEFEVLREPLIDFRVHSKGGNTSAPSNDALVRCQTELYWIAKHFFDFDEATLRLAFRDRMNPDERSPQLFLADYLIQQNRPYSVLTGADVLRAAVRQTNNPALRLRLREITAKTDPFGLYARAYQAQAASAPPTSFSSVYRRNG